MYVLLLNFSCKFICTSIKSKLHRFRITYSRWSKVEHRSSSLYNRGDVFKKPKDMHKIQEVYFYNKVLYVLSIEPVTNFFQPLEASLETIKIFWVRGTTLFSIIKNGNYGISAKSFYMNGEGEERLKFLIKSNFSYGA